jgi:hypothetical protein
MHSGGFERGKDIFAHLPRRTVAEIKDFGGVGFWRAGEVDFDLEAASAEAEEGLRCM